ncbi:ESPR-type extended signal peptide-containing protein [Variovorax sp. VNK109]|uniref:ESPR-type extended signal peptide-containing protein n=1 Tax=Variovorax sp. VNK109 TaxID=3400919 RepID=UPI003C076692
MAFTGVFNRASGTWQAVGETARCAGKASAAARRTRVAASLFMLASMPRSRRLGLRSARQPVADAPLSSAHASHCE